jgi:hypothetical protein
MSEQVHNLSDMEFDEVSFVHKGANQKAKIVLWKSDDLEPDHRDVTEGYAISKQYTAQAEVIRKQAGNLVLAERAEARLSELRKSAPLTSYEQAVAVVLNEDPSLYQP